MIWCMIIPIWERVVHMHVRWYLSSLLRFILYFCHYTCEISCRNNRSETKRSIINNYRLPIVWLTKSFRLKRMKQDPKANLFFIWISKYIIFAVFPRRCYREHMIIIILRERQVTYTNLFMPFSYNFISSSWTIIICLYSLHKFGRFFKVI